MLLTKQSGLLGRIKVVVGFAEESFLPETLDNGIENKTDHRVRLLDASDKLFISLALLKVTLHDCVRDKSDPKSALFAKFSDLQTILALLSKGYN